MKKILAGFIAFTMLALAGSAAAWDINVQIDVQDADVNVNAAATGENYIFVTAAGVDGTGKINIHGTGGDNQGVLLTRVQSHDQDTDIYAYQGLGVKGCLVECGEEPCNECPEYMYTAESSAALHGQGEIFITGIVSHNLSGQIFYTYGEGDFTAGMISNLWIEDQQPVTHAMGIYGKGVGFYAFGVQGMDPTDGTNAGMFTADMQFLNPGCDTPDCGEID